MNITGKKDLTEERRRAREVIDRIYVPRVNAAMGPKFALYQAKAQSALGGTGIGFVTISDNPQDIIDRFDALSHRVAVIENDRQEIQARVDNATSSAEIDKIIEGINAQ